MKRTGFALRMLCQHFQVVALFMALLPPGAMLAQIAGTANLQGTVTDSTGAVIPGAAVVATNIETQVAHKTLSDKSGVYTFPNLSVGGYKLEVSASGFKSYVIPGIVLEVGNSISVNPALAVGSASSELEVAASGLSLQTEDAAFKQTIDQHEVTEMPLNGRQMTGLIQLTGGATPAPAGDFTGTKYSYQTIAVSIAGGSGNTTSWRLDGGDNDDYMSASNLPFPFPDAVAEFSVESSALGSQTGEHSGGLVNVVTRSGTNQYHGSGFEFLRNNYINATNFFATSKDKLHQNQFGGTVGGPILKGKLFGFAGYQRLLQTSASTTSTGYVPTAANLAGDWSVTDPAPGSAATNCGKPQQLYDPLTGAALPGNKYTVAPVYNQQALNLQKYLPVPNPATDIYNCGLVTFAIPVQLFDNEFVARIDYTIGARDSMYGRYFIDGYQAPAFFSPTNILITQNAPGNYERVQSIVIAETHTFSPTLVNTVYISGSKRVDLRESPPGINANTLGIDMFTAEPTGGQFSIASAGKNHGFSVYCGTCSPGHFNDDSEAVSDNLSLVSGKHQFAIGGEYLRNQLNTSAASQANGAFAFNGTYSGNGPAGGQTVGDANLDFLTGAMSSFTQSLPQQLALRAPIVNLFVQDTFHATRRLTLTGGIRWEPYFSPSDYYGRGITFSQAGFLAGKTSSVYPNAPAGVSFYGDPGVKKTMTQDSPWQFSPNVGATYDLLGNGSTVLRGGAEVAYDTPNFYTGNRAYQTPPFATASSPATSSMLCFSEPWLVGGTGYGCNQVGGTNSSPYPLPPVPTPSQATFPAQGQYYFYPSQFHPSDTLLYTASVQHKFGRGWQAQVDYIGSRTVHMPIGLTINPAVYTPGVWGANGTGCNGIARIGPAAVTPGAAGTPCSTTQNQNSRFALTEANPYQGNQFAGAGYGTVLLGDTAYGNYNGMVASVEHRLSSTFSLLSNFTWSKCMNIVDAQGDIAGTVVENPYNLKQDYGRCGSDYRRVFNTTMIAQSHFSAGRLESLLVNGWEFAPLLHILSGAPIQYVQQGSDISLTDVGNDRPNVVPGINPIKKVKILAGAASQATRGFLNPAAFALDTVPGTYGNYERNSLSGPITFQFDAQVSRKFALGDRLSTVLRLEAFNVLNHPSFANPSATNPSSASFGEISSTSIGARIFQGSVKVLF